MTRPLGFGCPVHSVPLPTDSQAASPQHNAGQYNANAGPGDALAHLEAAKSEHPFWTNRLFLACQSGTLTLDDFRYLFSQYYLYSKNFTRYLAALMTKCDDDKLRAQLIANLYEEGGALQPEQRHSEIFRGFLTKGLQIDIDSIEFDETTRYFVREYLDYCSTSHPAAASAFLALGTEAIVPRMYGIFVEAMLRANVKEEHLQFFRTHMACDDAHAATIVDIMTSYAASPGWYDTCLQGMNHALDLRARFFENVFDELQYRRIQRIVENISTKKSMLAETKDNEGFGGLHWDPKSPGRKLYDNKVEKLNIDFAVERVPFKCEVLDPRIVRIPPGKFNEKHRHAHETIFYYLEGRGQVLVDDEIVEVVQGDAVFVPRWAIHQSQNLGDQEMVILAITDYGLTGKAFMGNYYRVSRGKEDLFQKYSIVDFIDREFWADPYPLLTRARTESPVYYSETFDAWFLTRYADIDTALRDDRLSSRRASFKFAGLPPDMRDKMRPFERSMGQWMIFNDPPDHTRLRSFSSKLFSPKFIASLRPSITRVVNELLDGIAGNGEADLMRDLGSPLPGIVVADMLGVTGADRRKFEKWSDDIAAFAGASEAKRELADAGLRSWRDMTACVKEVVEARRRHPEDDFLTSLLAVTSTGDQLTEEELLSSCIVLLAAGHGATQDTVCNSILTLLRNPEALAQVRADPDLLDTTGIDELLRFESALQLASRVALDDLVIGGQQIRKGQRVMSMLGAANRDPEQFPEPDTLDLHRKVNRHTAFGVGAHYCIGGPLGRLEGIVTVNAVLARFPKLQLATDKLEWKTSISFRGVRALPVRF
jgi:hypothetical protein